MKRNIIRAIVLAIMVQAIPLEAVAPQSYQDKIVAAVHLKIAQIKRAYRSFKVWLDQEETQENLTRLALGVGLLGGSYWYLFHNSNPFNQRIQVGNVECNGLQRDIPSTVATAPHITLVQLEAASQTDIFTSLGQYACPHYAIYFDAMLHNQLANPQGDFAQRFTNNDHLVPVVQGWRQFIIAERTQRNNATAARNEAKRVRNAARRASGSGEALERFERLDDLNGGDLLEGPEMVSLIQNISAPQQNFYTGVYNYAVVDDMQVLGNQIGLNDPTAHIVQGLANNQNYTAGVIVNTAVQYAAPDGNMRGDDGHWLIVRVVKRNGALSFYIADSTNHVRFDDPVVRRIVQHLTGVQY